MVWRRLSRRPDCVSPRLSDWRLGALVVLVVGGAAVAIGLRAQTPAGVPPRSAAAVIEHVVVIYQENNSFDHYFGTYPHATNPPGEPRFEARPGTPAVEGLSTALLTANPNATNAANGAEAANPFRLDRSEAATADQEHSYTSEQVAYDHGKMDLFPTTVGRSGPPPGVDGPATKRALNLGYFDGNTVTALWNYAQRFAMSDHFFQTTFGPSVPGALNLVSGQTNGIVAVRNGTSPNVMLDGGAGSFTLVGDADPIDDQCASTKRVQVRMGGPTIADLLNAARVSWGWFEAGFDLTATNPNGSTGCARSHRSAVTTLSSNDYVPHHDPFQYYTATTNPTHVRPSAVAAIGRSGDGAHHQYDLTDFFAAVEAGHFPAVSYLKPAAYQNGHAGYSDPLDEQHFLVDTLNYLQRRPEWATTVVFVTWDDSDGWYDHVMGPVVNSSVGPADALTTEGLCGDGRAILPGISPANPHAMGRCGYGPRLPLLALSPWARENFVDHAVTDHTSIARFIEDVFLDGRRIGGGSFDALSGRLDGLFDFRAPPHLTPLLLNGESGQ
jgi:phospholipase C